MFDICVVFKCLNKVIEFLLHYFRLVLSEDAFRKSSFVSNEFRFLRISVIWVLIAST